MSKFEVGQRVAVYGIDYDYGWFERDTGIITEVNEMPPRVLYRPDGVDGPPVVAIPQQCRKLVRKERRRLFVEMQTGTSNFGKVGVERFAPQRGLELVEFVEVRKRK